MRTTLTSVGQLRCVESSGMSPVAASIHVRGRCDVTESSNRCSSRRSRDDPDQGDGVADVECT